VKHGCRSDNDRSKSMSMKSNLLGTLDPWTAATSHSRQTSPFTEFMCRELYTPVDEQATCYFFQNYFLEDFKGFYSCLPCVYNARPIGSALGEIIISLGMAGMSDFKKDAKLMIDANIKYMSALHNISAALRDKEEAKTDQILTSVMLLGLYEVCHSIIN
jgi:hypothetical protein